MSLLSISLNWLQFLDHQKTNSPLIRLSDLKFSLQGMPSGAPNQIPIALAPQQTVTFANTARTLSYNGSTSFGIFLVPNSTNVRLTGAFGQRTARAYGDATTVWNVSVNNNVCRFTYGSIGTAPTFGGMQIGDGITVTDPFNVLNQGDFVLTNVNSSGGYVEFINPRATGESFAGLVQIYSNGPVQVGDSLYITNSTFNAVNQGTWQITRITDTYVEFSNSNAVSQSALTGISTGVSIYNSFYNWMLMFCDQRLQVNLNGDNTSLVEVEPPVAGDLSGNPGLFLKRGRVFSVSITNPSSAEANGIIILTT